MFKTQLYQERDHLLNPLADELDKYPPHIIRDFIVNEIKPLFDILLRSVFYSKFKNGILKNESYPDISEQVFHNQYYHPEFFKQIYYATQILKSDFVFKLVKKHFDSEFNLTEYVLLLRKIEEEAHELFYKSLEKESESYIEISSQEKQFLENLYKLIKNFRILRIFDKIKN